MLLELEDEEYNIYNDTEKIMLMNKDKFNEYLNYLDYLFIDIYGENTNISNPYLFQLFIIICKNGNEELYNWLKEFKQYKNFSCVKGYFECLKNNHISLYKKMIINDILNNNINLLNGLSMDCAEIGNLEIIKWLYSLNKFVNNDNDKYIINYLNLLSACIHNQVEVAKWLFENYANTIDLSKNNYFLITKSCESCNINLIKWLLSLCSNIKIDDIINDAFFYSRNCNLEFCQWLYNLVDNDNKITEESFCQNMYTTCCNNFLDKAKWLYSLKPEIYKNMSFEKSFFRASNIDMCKWILEIKPDFDIRISDDYLFIYGYQYKKYDYAKWLLTIDKSIDVCAQNNKAIRYCLYHENLEEVKWLLNYNPKLDLTENNHAIFKEFLDFNKINSINILIQLVPGVYQIKIKDNEIYAYKITNSI